MSYWTYTDLFEEPGPPTAAFEGGFGLLNRDGIRKPAFFAYKYLHALQGSELRSNDSQSMVTLNSDNIDMVLWDFKQPEQSVSNRSFYTKLLPSVPTNPIELHVLHVPPRMKYELKVYRTGYRANDAYSAYLAMGSPKDLTAKQIGELNKLTDDHPEKRQSLRSNNDGEITVALPMRSNDIVLVVLTRQHGGD
jgi:xylan 1,4-beta-xylosidase